MNPMALAFRALIWGYRVAVSPFFAPSCRYLPTCSEYAAEAVSKHGAARGGRLAVRRLARCHPWGRSGFDPVPETAPRGDAMHHRS